MAHALSTSLKGQPGSGDHLVAMLRTAVSHHVKAVARIVACERSCVTVAPRIRVGSEPRRVAASVRLLRTMGAARFQTPLHVLRSSLHRSNTEAHGVRCSVRTCGGATRAASSGGQVARTAAARRLELWDQEAARQRGAHGAGDASDATGATIAITVDGHRMDVPVGWRPSTLLSGAPPARSLC